MSSGSKKKGLPKLIGVVHLQPLPGSPGARHQHPEDALQEAGIVAVQEAQALVNAGFDSVILENFGDVPFYKDKVPLETVASLSIIAAAVREAVDVQVGINILRNDADAALAIAAVTGCDFIRVNILSGIYATDQGIIEGNAAVLLRDRDRLQASNIAILADVHVKHAHPLLEQEIGLAVEEVGLRAMADGVIVTGATTGRLVSTQTLDLASEAARKYKIPLYIGSGATPENLAEIKPKVDGLIVGSTLRKGGQAGAPLDPKRMREFIQAVKTGTAKKSSRLKKKKSAKKRKK